MARSVFGGRFAGHRTWRHRHRGFVVGWIGPLFWPYVYVDLFDYTFWPYAYDAFWPYAYDDVYVGIFGPYGYQTGGGIATPTRRRTAAPSLTGICGDRVPAWSDWPIERIAQGVNPDPSQQGLLDELKAATARAVQILQEACPSDIGSTPIGRIEATGQRLDAMLRSVQTVRPALEKFYNALTDEQKSRFNSLGAQPDETRIASRARKDLAQICRAPGPLPSDVPIREIERAVQPTPAQRSAFEGLKSASATVTANLKANCPQYAALTPTGRVAVMEQRLSVALEAVRTIEPALKDFYQSLSDEQKARFNRIGR